MWNIFGRKFIFAFIYLVKTSIFHITFCIIFYAHILKGKKYKWLTMVSNHITACELWHLYSDSLRTLWQVRIIIKDEYMSAVHWFFSSHHWQSMQIWTCSREECFHASNCQKTPRDRNLTCFYETIELHLYKLPLGKGMNWSQFKR